MSYFLQRIKKFTVHSLKEPIKMNAEAIIRNVGKPGREPESTPKPYFDDCNQLEAYADPFSKDGNQII